MTSSSTSSFDVDSILYHGEGLLAWNKMAGVAVYSDSPAADPGLVEDLRNWMSLHPGVIDGSSKKRIHPLTLLEKHSTGVMLVAFRKALARKAQELQSEIVRKYYCLVAGPLPEEGTIESRLRTKVGRRTETVSAEVDFRTLASDDRMSFVEAIPYGGRSHQIRALFAKAGRPLSGDDRFGKKSPAEKFRQKFSVEHHLLHAASVSLPAKILGKEIDIEAPLPAAFLSVLDQKGWLSAIPGEPAGETRDGDGAGDVTTRPSPPEEPHAPRGE